MDKLIPAGGKAIMAPGGVGEAGEAERMVPKAVVENQASRRIMAKLGMREEGVLRENVLERGE